MSRASHRITLLFFAAALLAGAALVAPQGCTCGPQSIEGRVAPPAGGSAAAQLDAIELPPGFAIEVFSEDVPGARSLALGARGTVFVGTRKKDRVYALVDADGDDRAETTHVIASGLDTPNGVAFRDGDLYIAEISRILRLDDIEDHLGDPPEPVVVSDAFPDDRDHGWKFIKFGPDGQLYVPVGAPCNACLRDEAIYSSITRMAPEGGKPEVFANGVRNTVGFDWHPETGELWFTDNGRDRMGNDIPPDELNRAPRAGMHFGFPFCHGKDIPDPTYGDRRDCDEFVDPEQTLGPHVAALGMRFYTGTMFPAEYRNQIFIAEHGSWNRETPIGYRVMRVTLDDDGAATAYEPFASGWLGDDGEAFGRPVDVQVMPDGALLVSDDRAGAVYRISYAGDVAPQ